MSKPLSPAGTTSPTPPMSPMSPMSAMDRAAGLSDPTDGATVLVVDDTPDNLLLMSELLRDRYRV